MKKIVYICFVPLTKAIAADYHIDFLRSKGVTVEYWDVSALYFERASFPDSLEGEYIKRFTAKRELYRRVDGEDPRTTVYVILLAYCYSVMPLLYRLTRKKCRMVYFHYSSQPELAQAKKPGRYLRALRKALSIGELRDYFRIKVASLAKKYSIIKPYDIVFCAGRRDEAAFPGSALESINFFDYDTYLRTKDLPAADLGISGRYCVFLDSNLTHHPDISLMRLQTVDPGRYYESLNRFFSEVERVYGLEVVIAAHPKARYEQNPFNGRKIFWYKPHELARSSDLVVTFGSFSISYAVLYNKPMLFLTSGDIMQRMSYFYPGTVASADELKLPIVNIDEPLMIEQDALAPDAGRYAAYKYRYLTSKGCESRLSRDIVYETLSRI